MFMLIVFIFLMVVLIMASGAALHMALFKAHRKETGFVQKALGGFISYVFSTVAWLTMYSHRYLDW
jgi:hypothetical protein